jgi:hypothetical protein
MFIATDTSTQFLGIKTKVFFHTFVAPIMFAATIFVIILTDNKTINIVFGCGLVLGSLIKIFSTDRKYLTEFQIVNGSLCINYVTPFLKLKSKQFNLADVSSIEIERANWLVDYPASVNIKHQEGWLKFEIIDKILKTKVRRSEVFIAKQMCAD